MTEPALRVDGLNGLRRDLRKLGDDLGDLKAANARVADVVVPAATARAPRRTGRLAGSVRASKGAARVTVSAGSARLPYAGVIHYGWPARRIEPHPFLTDAAHETEPRWLPAYEREVEQLVDRINGKTYD